MILRNENRVALFVSWCAFSKKTLKILFFFIRIDMHTPLVRVTIFLVTSIKFQVENSSFFVVKNSDFDVENPLSNAKKSDF